jgi:hypothetical protein
MNPLDITCLGRYVTQIFYFFFVGKILNANVTMLLIWAT